MQQSLDTAANDFSAETKPRTYLISGPIDAFLIGGFSILVFLGISFFLGSAAPAPAFVALVFYLSFAVNFPHFLVSYQLLYMDAGYLIFKNFRFFWAGVLVPLIMIGFFILAIFYEPQWMLGNFANAMYFLVGWHYVKQIYGGVIVTNALQTIYFTGLERAALQFNLYSVWGLSWISFNTMAVDYNLDGIAYKTFNLPAQLVPICYGLVIVSLLLVLATQIHKFVKSNTLPSSSSVMCFLSIYIWFLPTLYNPIFFFTIPFFHSLQYLPFVFAFRRNKVRMESADKTGIAKKKFYAIQLYGYLLLAVVTGATFFWFLPNYIDQHVSHVNTALYGPTLAIFCFTIFINIHHFFIDNVIWKGSNPEVRKYLFAKNTTQSQR